MNLPPDDWLLSTTQITRLFAHGYLSVILALYLVTLISSDTQNGLLLTPTSLGDTAVSLWMTTNVDCLRGQTFLY